MCALGQPTIAVSSFWFQVSRSTAHLKRETCHRMKAAWSGRRITMETCARNVEGYPAWRVRRRALLAAPVAASGALALLAACGQSGGGAQPKVANPPLTLE